MPAEVSSALYITRKKAKHSRCLVNKPLFQSVGIMNEDKAKITGVVLAGGRGRRMGGADKGLLLWRGRPLADYALDALRQVAGEVLINANRNHAEYARLGCPVIADPSEAFDGPLAGLLSALLAARAEYVLTAPCDAPGISGALLARLHEALTAAGAEVCAAHDGKRLHPVFLIAERRLAPDLSAYLADGGRKVETWLRSRRLALADYSDHPEMFVNINTPQDLEAWARAEPR
jgi:molybdopterin-guanine dinucleotide biosynthesis protein A